VLRRFIIDNILARASKVNYGVRMFPRLVEVIQAIEELKSLGLITDYAIAGAFALTVWDEASTTFDLDVLVLLNPTMDGLIVDMQPFYTWAAERGYEVVHEHIRISDVPVQLLPAAPDALSIEAVQEARTVPMMGMPVRVVSPEYLAALWLQPPANSAKRKARVEQMRESGVLNEAALAGILARYNT
jgi:hypothetical protein